MGYICKKKELKIKKGKKDFKLIIRKKFLDEMEIRSAQIARHS